MIVKKARQGYLYIIGACLGATVLATGIIVPVNDAPQAQGTVTPIIESQKYKVPSTVKNPELDRVHMHYEVERIPQVQAYMVASTNPDAFYNDPHWEVQYPFPIGVSISSNFGHRDPPCSSCSDFHQGTDFAVNEGTPIQPIAKGVVTQVGWLGDYGFAVTIEHTINGQKIQSLYGHMIENSSPLKVGDTVETGDLIGSVGNTGISTGAHLHLEIFVDGNKVDPLQWLHDNAGKAHTS